MDMNNVHYNQTVSTIDNNLSFLLITHKARVTFVQHFFCWRIFIIFDKSNEVIILRVIREDIYKGNTRKKRQHDESQGPKEKKEKESTS